MRKSENMDSKTDYLDKLGYETRDIDLGAIVGWITRLFVFIGVTSFVTAGLYWGFLALAKAPRADSGPAIARRLPPDPNPTVQPNPVLEIRNFRQEEEEKVKKVDWKDRNARTFTIPVDRAMDLTLQRHALPVRGQTSTSKPTP
jgi:hypothetical protein